MTIEENRTDNGTLSRQEEYLSEGGLECTQLSGVGWWEVGYTE